MADKSARNVVEAIARSRKTSLDGLSTGSEYATSESIRRGNLR